MSDDPENPDRDDSAGLAASGNPPKDGRFKPGRSGNPKGRPRQSKAAAHAPLGSEPTAALYRKLGRQQISVRIGGKLKKMSQMEAVAQGHYQNALNGNRFARREILKLLMVYDADDAKLVDNSIRKMRRYQDQCWDEIAECVHLGLPVPKHLPHPDDIFFEPFGVIIFKGPKNPREQRQWDQLNSLADEADDVIDKTLDFIKGKPKRVPIMFDEMVHAHRRRVKIRFVVPDEDTRRRAHYNAPTVNDIKAQNASVDAEFPFYEDLSPVEVARFVSRMTSARMIREHDAGISKPAKRGGESTTKASG